MSIKFSDDQLKVIQTGNRNILVSAAAGSGKTTVLVERIIQKICDKEHPVDIDRLLIVTFTKAAAASMRQKISEALDKRLSLNPEEKNIQRQSILLHNAQITTIDSFCLNVIKNNFNDIGLEPGFRVADEGEIRLLKEEVMEQLLEDKFQRENNQEFVNLANRFCKKADLNPLCEVLDGVYNHALSYPFPLQWIDIHREDYSEKMEYLPQVVEYVRRTFQGLKLDVETLLDVSLTGDGPYMYEEALKSDLEAIKEVLKENSFEGMYQKFQTYSFAKLSSKKDESVNQDKRDSVKQQRNLEKETVNDLKKQFFAFPLPFVKQEDLENRKILQELLNTVEEFHYAFQKEKRERKLIDFSDMEHFALEILLKKGKDGYEPTDAAKEYREYFEEIMIDEYQDSNLVQEWLLKAVSRENEGCFNRFMVGDVKQSIYRFRMACPQLFMEKYDRYQPDGNERMRIDLSRNYRSRKEILSCTNVIFRKIMGKDLGNIEYDKNQELNYGSSYTQKEGKEDLPELIILHKDPEVKNSREYEASVVAHRILSLVRDYQVTDEKTGQLRNTMFKDIVILLRNTKQWDEIMRRTFEQYGIPAHITTKEGYFATAEIQNVINLLQILDNPKQDIPLYGVMHSIFGSFSENEIAVLAAVKKTCGKRYLYDVIVEIPDTQKEFVGDALMEKCRKFLEFLNRYRAKVKYEPIHKLLRELFDETDYLVKISAAPGGEQKKRNVLALLEKAETYEKSSMKGLFSFIRYIEKMKKYKVEVGEAVLNEEGVNAVQIMSIHKSKGLEFPVCIVAGLGTAFNQRDLRNAVICDTDYGIGFDYADLEKRAKYPNLRNNYLKKRILEDNLGEELRILYVAFTRAKEKLILTGMGKDTWEEACPFRMPLRMRLRAKTPLDFILPAAVNEDVISVREISSEELDEEDIKNVVSGKTAKEELLDLLKENPRKKEAEQLKEKLKRPYRYENLQDLYTKVSVSELKIADMQKAYQQENKEEPSFLLYGHGTEEKTMPRFLQEEKEPGGSDRGTAYHRVLELFPFAILKENQNQEELDKYLKDYFKKLISDGRMQERELSLVRQDRILQFLLSDLAKRIAAADRYGKLKKEQPFVLGIEASRLNEKFPKTEKVLIQGIIDLFFEEENGIVLLDYKTDAVKEGKELVKRYRTQLDYYTEAIERITGKKVVEKLLYSFALNQPVSCN